MMKWDTVHISDKIEYLKEILSNSTEYDEVGLDIIIVNALITGSKNTFDGDLGFEMNDEHITWMRNLWNTHIITQKDESVINTIKLKLRGKS